MTQRDDPIGDHTLAARLMALPRAGKGADLVVSPHGRRMFEVRFSIDEGGTLGQAPLVARVPSGGRGRSTALRALGWRVETVGGTRYITRRFDTSDQAWEHRVVRELRTAYLAAYGDRRTFAHWSQKRDEIGPVTPGKVLLVAVALLVGTLATLALLVVPIWLYLGLHGIWLVTSPEPLQRWIGELDPVVAVPVVTTACVALVGLLVVRWWRQDRDRAG